MTLSIQVPADPVAIAKAKAGDPTDVETYERIVVGLAADIKSAAASGEEKMFAAAAKRLDAKWSTLTATQQNSLLDKVGTIIEQHYVGMKSEVARKLKTYGRSVAKSTRGALKKRIDPAISPSLTSKDTEFISRVGENRAWFLKSQGEIVSKEYHDKARKIIADGASKGLSDKQVAKDLKVALRSKAIDQSEQYYRTVANAAMGRSRTWASLNSYNEAGFKGYVYKSILDESTTDTCRFLHNRRYLINDGIARMEKIERDALDNPESILDNAPFMQTEVVKRRVRDKKTGEMTTVRDRYLGFKKGEKFNRVAKINQSAVGTKDKIGDYKQLRSNAKLKADGFQFPPSHHL